MKFCRVLAVAVVGLGLSSFVIADTGEAQPAPAAISQADQNSIAEFRKQIDAIDKDLISLFNKRAQAAKGIGDIKKKYNLPVRVPAREEQIILSLQTQSRGPLSHDAIRRLWGFIFQEMRNLESEAK